ncbi:outer membrane protein assembly factor BamC [Candidatus Purcelliella pentastirinorum]|uniref:outer membrane protein assembly factor BamC n=1 Tax=Candidatus Purcelliella pentastirinorum TaxID=472834 RepID=UPI002367902D|nr:outer membrane protein assembly factor BamC [Candidatus Purcelliella pentastirinorum]WDI78929.1 outer membrane protein assembly factor BamC [Candidatus Purcelliella pentastirinorum]WDR80064.1 outer membrane protein assembly factor BamC [Candidatus Purcelliella pentastirinorum]
MKKINKIIILSIIILLNTSCKKQEIPKGTINNYTYYLKSFNLKRLKTPKNIYLIINNNINYPISIKNSKNKIGKKLNIYPPQILLKSNYEENIFLKNIKDLKKIKETDKVWKKIIKAIKYYKINIDNISIKNKINKLNTKWINSIILDKKTSYKLKYQIILNKKINKIYVNLLNIKYLNKQIYEKNIKKYYEKLILNKIYQYFKFINKIKNYK